MAFGPYVLIPDVVRLAQRRDGAAIKVAVLDQCYDSDDVWVQSDHIHADSEVYAARDPSTREGREEGLRGNLILTEWMAKQKGLTGEPYEGR